MLEGIIRFHPFSDGNKRTALLVTTLFLYLNAYRFAIPIDAVKFLANIAQNTSNKPDDVDNLIGEIATWLQERSSDTKHGYRQKLDQYFIRPVLDIDSKDLHTLKEKFGDWFALTMHPEYSQSITKVINFITNINNIQMEDMES